MVKIYNKIDKVNGDPQDLSILVELIWNKGEQEVPVHTDEEVTCDGPVQTACDNYGNWELEVQPNSKIYPDSFYRITHYREGEDSYSLQYHIFVTDDQEAVWTGNALTPVPEWYEVREWEWR